jgi:hypothetical protein
LAQVEVKPTDSGRVSYMLEMTSSREALSKWGDGTSVRFWEDV